MLPRSGIRFLRRRGAHRPARAGAAHPFVMVGMWMWPDRMAARSYTRRTLANCATLLGEASIAAGGAVRYRRGALPVDGGAR